MEITRIGSQVLPVTAIHYVQSLDVIIVARGPFVHVTRDLGQGDVVPGAGSAVQVFESHPVNGLATQYDEDSNCVFVLAWGGSFIRILKLSSTHVTSIDGKTPIAAGDCALPVIAASSPVNLLPSWILDASFLPDGEDQALKLCFLTAHNVLGLFSCSISSLTHDQSFSSVVVPPCTTFSPVRKVMLYCGHVVVENGSIVVASGTMFGQILVWKCPLIGETERGILLGDFHEHEGSVFGVRIKPVSSTSGMEYHVASCSDDRSVRVYRVLEGLHLDDHGSSTVRTGFQGGENAVQSRSTNSGTSSTSVHISRIWLVRWLDEDAQSSLLLSYGEDATVQVWHVYSSDSSAGSSSTPSGFSVERIAGYGNHFGKNIWATDIGLPSQGQMNTVVYTGGADGRVAAFKIDPREPQFAKCWLYEINQASKSHERTDKTQNLFLALEGVWDMHRVIESKRPEYPSGNFNGTATIMGRQVTDCDYDNEMLYKEEGQFSTSTGFSFPARRNYVYRYQKSSKTITAWFVKPDENEVVDYLFHQVNFSEETDSVKKSSPSKMATGYHLCVRDHYNASYEFDKNGTELPSWTLSYYVTGPEKDYIATCKFLRIDKGPTQPTQVLIKPETKTRRSRDDEDYYRSYRFIDANRCLAVTNKGCVHVISIPNNETRDTLDEFEIKNRIVPSAKMIPEVTFTMKELASYSIMSVLGSLGVLVADGCGQVYVVTITDARDIIFRKLYKFETRVSYIHTQILLYGTSPLYFVVFQCLGKKSIAIAIIDQQDLQNCISNNDDITSKIRLTTLEGYEGSRLTSVYYHEGSKTLIVGSRFGAVGIWCFQDNNSYELLNVENRAYIRLLHGENAVTGITSLDVGENKSKQTIFFTVGRDQRLKQHVIIKDAGSLSLKTVSDLHLPIGPNVEGIKVIGNPLRIFAWGFLGTYFVLWNYTDQQELMKVKCGIANRNWDFVMTEDQSRPTGTFMWTQAMALRAFVQREPLYTILNQGGHGREIKCIDRATIKPQNDSKSRTIVATGAQDTDIRLFILCSAELSTRGETELDRTTLGPLLTIHGHLAGVNQVQFAHSGRVLFSSGGMEEIFVWSVACWEVDSSLLPQVACIGKCPKVTEAEDLRITAFDIIENATGGLTESNADLTLRDQDCARFTIPAVYSDSSLRIWRFDLASKTFSLIGESRYTTNCLTCVRHVRLNSEDYIIVASSDGHVLLYSIRVAAVLRNKMLETVSGEIFRLVLRHRVHQSSIKSLDVCNINQNEVLVASGGDDNAVGFTRITSGQVSDAPEPFAVGTVLVPRAHTASVNAVVFLDGNERVKAGTSEGLFVIGTTGGDQKVISWHLRIKGDAGQEDHGLAVRKSSQGCHVADTTCMCDSNDWVVVAGVGMQVLPKTRSEVD